MFSICQFVNLIIAGQAFVHPPPVDEIMYRHSMLVLQYVRAEFLPVFADMLAMVETVAKSEEAARVGRFA